MEHPEKVLGEALVSSGQSSSLGNRGAGCGQQNRILCPNSEFSELVNQSRSTSVGSLAAARWAGRGDPNVRQLEPHWRIAYKVQRAPVGVLNPHISRSTGSF